MKPETRKLFCGVIAAILASCPPAFASMNPGGTGMCDKMEEVASGTDKENGKPAKKHKKEVKYNEAGEIIKTGVNFGPLPVVAFDADRGFQFGALLNMYIFGDGSTYPNPKSSWYIEASAYTKESTIGSYKFVVNYDNKTLIPGVRMSICTGYYKDAALDFYGFNGFRSNYDMELIKDSFVFDDQKLQTKFDTKGKMPKGFYRFGRDQVKAKIDFTGKILKNFFWEAGYNFSWIKAQDYITKGYTVMDGNSLFSLYKDWGIIPEEEAGGGIISSLRLGLMYDSRNIENNPTKGIWAEAHVVGAPKWLGTTHGHHKFCGTFRHYVPLGTEKLIFAYRLAYQGFFSNAPWYALPFYTTMGPNADYDGVGGYRTVRGLMLNRVQGLHTGFYNAEFRWRFIDFKLWKQNIAFAVSAFCDGAHVFKDYDMTLSDERREQLGAAAPEKVEMYNKFVLDRKDGFHGSAGAGLRFIMNQNFIVAFEYARCFNKQDGNGAFYINTGFLF